MRSSIDCVSVLLGEQEVADNNCVYRNEVLHSADERTQVLQDIASDPTLPRTKNVRCANCQHGEAVFFQVCLLYSLKYSCMET